MFLARYAEKAGSGIVDMIARCRQAGLRTPGFRQEGSQFIQTLWRPVQEIAPEVTPEVAKLLPLCDSPMTRRALQTALGLKDDEHFRLAYLQTAMATGLLEMTIPAKPNSRLQKYRLTDRGRAWVTQRKRDR